MLRSEAFGPVKFHEIARSLAGRHLMTSGIYSVDGLLIDTGPANARREFVRVLEEAGPRQVLLTHHHEDHVGNAAVAAGKLGVKPRAHPLTVDLVRRAPRLPPYRRAVWGVPVAVVAEPVGDRLETERYCFQVIHTPGHAPDHIALHEPTQDWLFVGDLYLGDRVRLSFSYEDIGTLIASLRRLLAIPDCVMFCQHTGYHAGHQHRLGRKLDFLLGLQQRAVVLLEEGRDVADITRALGIKDRVQRWMSRGEYSGRHLVRGLLRAAGKIE